jgi:hypothetical protein
MVSRQFCSLIFGALLCLSSAARAQQQPEQRSDQEIALVGSLLVSLQPELDGCCEPYLAGPLGGSKLGVGGSLTVAQPNGFVFAVELNTAMPMSGSQSGRIVPGPGAVVSTHGDTLISALPGVRQRLGTAAVDFLGGPTLVFGSSGQGGQSVDSAPGLAVTGGFDVILSIGARAAVVPSFRYTFAYRKEEISLLGLGKHILRPGIGVRIRLGDH